MIFDSRPSLLPPHTSEASGAWFRRLLIRSSSKLVSFQNPCTVDTSAATALGCRPLPFENSRFFRLKPAKASTGEIRFSEPTQTDTADLSATPIATASPPLDRTVTRRLRRACGWVVSCIFSCTTSPGHCVQISDSSHRLCRRCGHCVTGAATRPLAHHLIAIAVPREPPIPWSLLQPTVAAHHRSKTGDRLIDVRTETDRPTQIERGAQASPRRSPSDEQKDSGCF